MINGTVSLARARGLVLPIRMNVPVHIELGEGCVAPSVEDLHDVRRRLNAQIEGLPDGIGPKWR